MRVWIGCAIALVACGRGDEPQAARRDPPSAGLARLVAAHGPTLPAGATAGVVVTLRPDEMPALERAWGPGRSFYDGIRRYWFDPAAHVRAIAKRVEARGGGDAFDVEISPYLPIDELLGRTDGRLSIEKDAPLLGSSVSEAARVLTLPPTDEDDHPTEIHLYPDMDGVVRSFAFELGFFDGDRELRTHALELVQRDFHGTVDARVVGDALDVMVDARP
jgi:hypothetical protein